MVHRFQSSYNFLELYCVLLSLLCNRNDLLDKRSDTNNGHNNRIHSKWTIWKITPLEQQKNQQKNHEYILSFAIFYKAVGEIYNIYRNFYRNILYNLLSTISIFLSNWLGSRSRTTYEKYEKYVLVYSCSWTNHGDIGNQKKKQKTQIRREKTLSRPNKFLCMRGIFLYYYYWDN